MLGIPGLLAPNEGKVMKVVEHQGALYPENQSGVAKLKQLHYVIEICTCLKIC